MKIKIQKIENRIELFFEKIPFQMGFWGATISHLKWDFLDQITKNFKIKGILNNFIFFGNQFPKNNFFLWFSRNFPIWNGKICFKNPIWNGILSQISFSFWFSPENFPSEMGKSVSKISFEMKFFSKMSYFCIKLSLYIIDAVY